MNVLCMDNTILYVLVLYIHISFGREVEVVPFRIGTMHNKNRGFLTSV